MTTMQGINPREGLPKLRASWVGRREARGDQVQTQVRQRSHASHPASAYFLVCSVVPLLAPRLPAPHDLRTALH